jgi:hypothetical protein
MPSFAHLWSVRRPRPDTMTVIGLLVAGFTNVFFCKFGIWRRLVLTLLWLTFRAVSGVFPVITQILLIKIVGFECRNAT